MNPGYDQYDEGNIAYPGGSSTFDETVGGGPGNPWPTTSTGFGGAGTDPSVGGPGFSMPTVEGGGQGFQMPDWLTSAIGGDGSGGMTPQQIAYLAATTGMAGKQWNNAGEIENRFNEVADTADYLHPDRVKYAGQLANLMADPSQIENDPAYKFRLGQGLNTLGPQQAAKGGGYGNAAASMIDYAGKSASQELDAQTARLSNLAGFQFDQGRTAADLRTAGLTGRIASENAALGTLGYGLQNAFGSQPGGSNAGGGGWGGGNNPAAGIVNGVLSGNNAAQLGQAIAAGGAGAAKVLSDLITQGVKEIKLPDGTTIDVQAAARSGGGSDSPGGYGTYPTDTFRPEAPMQPVPEGGDPYTPITGGFLPEPPEAPIDWNPGFELDYSNLGF
jgi:hypothetical protein